MPINPLWLLGDLSVGLSFILPFVTVMLLSRRFEKLSKIRSYWQSFLFGIIAFLGYLSVYWLDRTRIIDLGVTLLAYITPLLLLMSIANVIGIIYIYQMIEGLRLRFLLGIILANLTLPIAVNLAYEFLGHTPLLPHPMGEIIQTQAFMSWTLLSYSYFLLGKLISFVSGKSWIYTSISSTIFVGVGVSALYAGGNLLYGEISLPELQVFRGVFTALGAFGGLLTFISSLSIIHVRTQPSSSVKMDRVETGIPELDDALHGGCPYPTSIVFVGEIGTGKTTLVQRIMVKRLAEGDGVVVLCLNDTPENDRKSMIAKGFDPRPFEEQGRLALIDAYTTRAGVVSTERYGTTLQLSDMSITLWRVITELKGERRWVIIDSLTTIFDESDTRKALTFLRMLIAKVRVSKICLMATYTSAVFSPAISALVQESFDGTVELVLKGTRREIIVPRLKDIGRIKDGEKSKLGGGVGLVNLFLVSSSPAPEPITIKSNGSNTYLLQRP